MTKEPENATNIYVELDRRINLAMQQNDVPMVKSLRIHNATNETLCDLDVSISTEPAFAKTWKSKITTVMSKSSYNFEVIDLILSPEYLWSVTEKVKGLVTIKVEQNGSVLAQSSTTVELLSHNEWGGLSSLPEIIAAYVMPNHPAVDALLKSAAGILEKWTKDSSLNGYQSNSPRRIYIIAAAVYAAIGKLELDYIYPPASFENQGQRIRLPDQIIDTRLVTCLDVALFAASCLEQIGLNALILMVQGHAFTGVWLRNDCFSEPAIDDNLRVRKRLDLNEIVVFDPTCVTARPMLGYEQAVTEAKHHLAENESFLCAIDVKRARKGLIRPLPERVKRTADKESLEFKNEGISYEPAMPDVSKIELDSEPIKVDPEPVIETPSTRIDRWCRKLLDLSLRNRLLNFRDTKKSLKLLCPDLAIFEDMLAEGKKFNILSRPPNVGDIDNRDAATHFHRTGKLAIDEMLANELKAKRIYGDTTSEDLKRRLTEIYRAAKLSLEEGGASALYLSIGFLVWYETERSEKKRLAPLLLLPLELHRKSVHEGFSLCLADSEARINVTLLELLNKDHGIAITGLDPLPEDESGLDVPQIFQTIKKAVRDIDRWEVINETRIGFFSFTKFLMWRDLSERINDLMKNTVVDHLVNRSDQPFDPDAEFPRTENLDKERTPMDTFCPLPADSSQLSAVFAAAQGRSFVLEGPPGTGKSQTISNLISHCLCEGKTVLFVSQKMAALNVVHRRLVSIGLGRYCLELHSNKSQKRQVISDLALALQKDQPFDEEEWKTEATRLDTLRNDLNIYVEALHKKRSTGETVFQATSRLIGLRDVPHVNLNWPGNEVVDAEALAGLRDTVERVATAGSACGEVKSHIWREVNVESWTMTWEEEVQRAISQLIEITEALSGKAFSCANIVGIVTNGWSLSDLDLVRDLSLKLMIPSSPPIALLVRPNWDDIQILVSTWIEHGKIRDQMRDEMRQHFRDEIIGLDLNELRAKLTKASGSWWPSSWWRRRPIKKALKSVSNKVKSPKQQEMESILNRALAFRGEQRKLDSASEQARELLGHLWKDGEAEWDGIAEFRDWANELRTLSFQVAGNDLEYGESLRTKWGRLMSEEKNQLRREGQLGKLFLEYNKLLHDFKESCKRASDLLKLDEDNYWSFDTDVDLIGRIKTTATSWLSGIQQLRDWCAWRRARKEAIKRNLQPIIISYEQGEINSSQLSSVFERSFTQWWLSTVIDGEKVLRNFFSPEHERKISQFRQVDDHYTNLTRQLIQARLAQRIPSASSSVLPNSEMGVLMRESGKKRRHIAIRQLLKKIPNLLPRLKPCLLMSPMSVAQYLSADHPEFDVVVFDEASQIPVWDAVGAIARGQQAVIVGDPKQLPPTNFFQRSDDDEEMDDDGTVEDLESILDDCIGAQIPCQTLDWHYRSRHESLIMFSNYHYYNNRLLTFPSASIEGLGVSWHHVPNGIYDKGKTRTNRAEAEAVVSEIIGRLRNPNIKNESIGVVTFSQAQQSLIEDLIDAERAKNKVIDQWLAEESVEPIFVKNLENVQGDERDIILFSICYGPDNLGRVSMNFGPMNREGGERRLNVAITRARSKVMVFSTLKANQIDLTRTRARGVRDLKYFLEYAERGPIAISEAIQSDPDADFDSPFEMAVYDALISKGWLVHKQVGCANYRIDLAVVDPINPGRYLLGVECDGANYHRAKTARDRDKLREAVLRDLGWNIHRVWSTDWWTDPDREISKIEKSLKAASQNISSTSFDEKQEEKEYNNSLHVFAQSTPKLDQKPNEEPQLHLFKADSSEISVSSEIEIYRPITIDKEIGTIDDFNDSGMENIISEKILEIVCFEGPISLKLTAKRIAKYWGLNRISKRTLTRIKKLIPNDEVSLVESESGSFLWLKGSKIDSYKEFRVPDFEGNGERQATDLPPEEIYNGILHILKSHISAPIDELIRETARLFGFKRVGRVVDKQFRICIANLVKNEIVVENGTMISLQKISPL
jgi:very-short-patch-repair endonuclease/DNA polymerase III delta prime subunit